MRRLIALMLLRFAWLCDRRCVDDEAQLRTFTLHQQWSEETQSFRCTYEDIERARNAEHRETVH